jgi:hypothetical protein
MNKYRICTIIGVLAILAFSCVGSSSAVSTYLNVTASNINSGDSEYISVSLIDSYHSPLANKTIHLGVHTTDWSYSINRVLTTFDNGKCDLLIFGMNKVGDYVVTAEFNGDGFYGFSNAITGFTVFPVSLDNNSTDSNGTDTNGTDTNGTDTNGTVIDNGGVPGNGGVVDGPVTNTDFGLLGDIGLPLTTVPLIFLVSLLATIGIFVVGYKY